MWEAPDQLRGSVPPEIVHHAQAWITRDLVAQVMDEEDEGRHGQAIVDTIEDRLPIEGGLKGAYENPSTELIFNRGSGAIVLVMEKPEDLIDGNGRIHLVCDQYAELARSVLIPGLSPRAHHLHVVSHRKLGVGEHVGAHFKVGEHTHESRGVPRWYRGVTRWKKSEAIAGGFLWEVRNIGEVVREENWDTTQVNYYPYSEFPYRNGHAMVTAALILLKRTTGREEIWVSLKIFTPLPEGEQIEAIYRTTPDQMNGVLRDANTVEKQILFLRKNQGITEKFNPSEEIKTHAVEAISCMISKKLKVS